MCLANLGVLIFYLSLTHLHLLFLPPYLTYMSYSCHCDLCFLFNVFSLCEIHLKLIQAFVDAVIYYKELSSQGSRYYHCSLKIIILLFPSMNTFCRLLNPASLQKQLIFVAISQTQIKSHEATFPHADPLPPAPR